jgi:hypothetical protein
VLQDSRFGLARTVKAHVNQFHHAREILPDVVIPETEHAVALAFEPLRSHPVADFRLAFAMLRTVDFDDETARRTGKVDDIISDGHLAAEMSAARPKPLQMAPQQSFGVGRILTQTSGGIALELVDRT